jgi:hypothetical protein
LERISRYLHLSKIRGRKWVVFRIRGQPGASWILVDVVASGVELTGIEDEVVGKARLPCGKL